MGRVLVLTVCIALSAAAADQRSVSQTTAHPYERVKEKELDRRIEKFSALFLGAPYADDSALGEGPTGRFDQNPLARFDTFHCVTYLETVVALATARAVSDFEKRLRRIRYKGGKIAFETRNHFPCLDWIPNNLKNGVFEDITAQVAAGSPLNVATASIDRRAWYEFMPISRIVLPEADDAAKEKRLEELHALGKNLKPEEGRLSYIPFEILFPQTRKSEEDPLDDQAPANDALFDRIPSGAVVTFVRPNWNVLKVIGTRMNVSHQGFLVRTPNGLMLRHAKSEVSRRVVDESFVAYLRRAMTRKSMRGIHLLKVRSPKP